jgi:hypothetical protein
MCMKDWKSRPLDPARVCNTCSGVLGDQFFKEHLRQPLAANLHLVPSDIHKTALQTFFCIDYSLQATYYIDYYA